MIIINAEAKKHKTDFSKYEITNETLFKKTQPDQNMGRPGFGGGFGGGYGRKVAKAKKAGWGGQEDEETDVFQDEVSIEQRTQYADNLMEEIVVKPYLETLELLTSFGADPQATVQKLKRFREIDEEKKRLELVKNSKDEAVIKAY